MTNTRDMRYYNKWRGNATSRYSSNSEASASELLGNREDIYYVLHGWSSAGSNLQLHTGVLFAAKGLTLFIE